MPQHMAHTYHIFPLHLRVLRLQFLCEVVGSLTYNFYVLHHSIKENLIMAKVIQSLAFKKLLHIANSC